MVLNGPVYYAVPPAFPQPIILAAHLATRASTVARIRRSAGLLASRPWAGNHGDCGFASGSGIASGAQDPESEIELLEEDSILRKLSFAAADHARDVSFASQS